MVRYRPEVLEQLLQHGLVPRPQTPPEPVYDLLKAIYTFEIRAAKLRHQEVARVLGPQPLDAYREAVRAIQNRYPVLRLPPTYWVER
jgi:hypothetical protein